MKQYDKSNVVEPQKELANCTFVKTILMLLVVFYHSITFWVGNWFTKDPVVTSKLLENVAKWLNTFHIYAFTLVSGYIFYHKKCEKGRYDCFPAFVKNKAMRLLIPYVFVAAVWVIPVQCLFLEYDVKTVFYNYVLATSPSQLWFLVMLFNVFIIFWPLSDFFRKHNLAGAVVAIGMYGCSIVGGMILPNIFMIFTALRYVLFFWIGFKLRQNGTEIIRRIPAVLWIMASVLLFVLTQYFGSFESVFLKGLKVGLSHASNIVGALMAFVVLQNIADKASWNNKCFAFFSSQSMLVYLLHQQIIYFFIYWLNGIVNPYLNAAINFTGSLAVSLAASSVLMRFRVTRFLMGEK